MLVCSHHIIISLYYFHLSGSLKSDVLILYKVAFSCIERIYGRTVAGGANVPHDWSQL